MPTTRNLRIGLALGGGGAAALAYIGVLEELSRAGLRFDCIAGTSAGAVVGAAFAAGHLEEFRSVMTSITRGRMFTLFDPVWSRGGLIGGRRAIDLIAPTIGTTIEKLPIRFAAVATDLDSGEEVILDHGSVADALRASIAIPGVFHPQTIEGRVLVDGGLSDPIPVSVARRLGADFVLAVSILRLRGVTEGTAASSLTALELAPALTAKAARTGKTDGRDAAPPRGGSRAARASGVSPGILDVLAKGSAVVQAHIAAARLRDDPPDAFLSPRAEDIGIFELVRTSEAVEAGREAGRRALPALLAAIEEAKDQRRGPLERLAHRFGGAKSGANQ